jgi:hypothetical protein
VAVDKDETADLMKFKFGSTDAAQYEINTIQKSVQRQLRGI